jgi:hypothetical protein
MNDGETVTTVRAKFVCNSVTKFKSGWGEYPFHFNYNFGVVSSDSDENKKFFAATPSGKVELSALNADLFEVGREYYLDFSLAPVKESK